jgi:hypothetical protein
MDIGFPDSSLVMLVGRGDNYIVPRGATVLRERDALMILTDRDDIKKLRAVIEGHVAQQCSAGILAGYLNPRIRTAAASDNSRRRFNTHTDSPA